MRFPSSVELRAPGSALRSPALLRALLEQSTDIVSVLDASGNGMFVSPAAERTLGFAPADLIGRSIFEFIHPDDIETAQAQLLELLTRRKTLQTELRLRRADGSWLWVENSCANLLDDEEIAGILIITRDISARKEVEAKLRRAEEYWRSLVQCSPDYILTVDAAGNVLFLNWSDRGSPDEWVGRCIYDYMPDDQAVIMREAIAGAFSSDVPQEVECRGPIIRGVPSWYRARIRALKDQHGTTVAAVLMAADVTERKQAESRLARYREVFASSLDAISITDTEGRYIEQNAAHRELFGYPDEELLGETPARILGQEGCDELERMLLRDGSFRGEFAVPRRTGEFLVIEVTAVPVHGPDGQVAWYVGLARDVTSKKHAEEALRRAKEEAEQVSRIKSEFLSNVSHELRTPLNAIVGFSKILERGTYGATNERQRRYLRNILEAGEHMAALVDDLLDLRRIEENRIELVPLSIPLGSVLEEALHLVQPLVEERRHVVGHPLGSTLPTVYADRRATVQVIANLLTNAAKYTDEGGTIEVSVVEEGAEVRIAIADSGIGIAPEDLPRVFDYFEQVHGAGSSRKGFGIGLAIARALVERMGGRICVESTVGKGSVFSFTLPSGSEGPGER